MTMRAPAVAMMAVLLLASLPTPAQKFSLEQALSTQFASDLMASPRMGRFAWVEDQQGRRNLWIAEPGSTGKYDSRKLTSYDKDDGQELYQIAWTPGADNLVYVRGGDSEFPGEPDPNPALEPQGVSQSIWVIASAGGSPRKLGDGYGPVISPEGDQVAYISHGQIWTVGLAVDGAKSKARLHTRGEISELIWAPDGHAIAFMSDRGDHGFIGVYDLKADTLLYLDPSTANDSDPAWSPDSRQIAFVREPGTSSPPPMNHRTASPWSLRIADVSTGKGRQLWKATEGPGSAFHEMHGQQLFWSSDNRLVFPWEVDGWLHLYSVPISGGKPLLLTSGNFEVEDVSLAGGKTLLYASNNQDIDRRHIWSVSVSGGEPKQLTRGTGIEAAPITGGQHIAVLHSDEHTPLRPALLDPDGMLLRILLHQGA